ncbi:MAG: tRNA (adenosine(37)-N6)-threonylcarbamoyltransferase complex dimerization subunit type 1 TsaB [Eubacteriales bacterium]
MKILALDSTAAVCSCAVCEDEKILSVFTVNSGNTHSETLLPMIEASLRMLSLEVSDIDLFAFSEGPGSFTGVRIGAATLKGLAFGRNKPCVGVSTLKALASNLSGMSGIVCPVMNARRNQVYNAVYRVFGKTLTELTADRAIGVPELEGELASFKEPIYLVGDGDFLLYESGKLNYAYVPEQLRAQSAASVALCALADFRNGTAVSDSAVVPTYLRPSQAERERNEKSSKENT